MSEEPKWRKGWDVTYVEDGVIKRIVPAHPEANPLNTIIAYTAICHWLADYVPAQVQSGTVVNQLTSVFARELRIAPSILVELTKQQLRSEFAVVFMSLPHHSVNGVCLSLEELPAYVQKGIEEVRKGNSVKMANGKD